LFYRFVIRLALFILAAPQGTVKSGVHRAGSAFGVAPGKNAITGAPGGYSFRLSSPGQLRQIVEVDNHGLSPDTAAMALDTARPGERS